MKQTDKEKRGNVQTLIIFNPTPFLIAFKLFGGFVHIWISKLASKLHFRQIGGNLGPIFADLRYQTCLVQAES